MNSSFNKSMSLIRKLNRMSNRAEYYPTEIARDWEDLFYSVCSYLISGDATTADVLYSELVAGNWKRLHVTEEESGYSINDWITMFKDEVFYCSDRWSFDRLSRCHWLFRRVMEALNCDIYGKEKNYRF